MSNDFYLELINKYDHLHTDHINEFSLSLCCTNLNPAGNHFNGLIQ